MFVKLYSRITESSLMEQPVGVRYTFLMLLAIADPTGRVVGTDVAIARRLNMPVDDFVKSVKQLGEPDEDSNSKEENGRRVLPSDGERGYQLVNYVKYRNLKDEDEKREYMREYMRKRRAEQSVVNARKVASIELAKVTQAEAEAEAEPERGEPTASDAARPPSLLAIVRTVSDAWNKLDGVPRCLVISDARRRKLESRLREPFFAANWQPALAKVQASPFCRGENDRGWCASLDWFLQPDVCAKIMEGKYDPKAPNAAHQKNHGKPHRNDFIAGAGTGPSTTEILRRRAEREANERLSTAPRPVAGQVAQIELVPLEGARGV